MNITKQREEDTRSANLSTSAGPSPIGRLLRFLERTAASLFYGKITISFQNGKVSDVRIEQTRKLDEL